MVYCNMNIGKAVLVLSRAENRLLELSSRKYVSRVCTILYSQCKPFFNVNLRHCVEMSK